MSDRIPVSVASLEKFSIALLTKAGLNRQDAATVTESLLSADLRGISSHGVVRLTSYIGRVRAGVMELNPAMEVEREAPAAALLNARNGLGQIAGSKAMALAMDKAEACGVGLVSVKNSNHFGIAAFFAMQALKRNMVGLVITNASPAIAPYGTKTPLTGTNPLAVAIPAAAERPIVLDMSTSVVARGKIRLASVIGEAVPLGWALDTEGKPTQDAKAALKGSMEPIGGPKGSGLSLVIDLLCGVLTGTSLTGEVKNVTDTSGPSKTSHMFIAINIGKFVDPEQFKKNIDAVIRRIKALPSASGSPPYLPGEIEFNLEAKRRAEGIPLSPKVIAELQDLARKYGVTENIG
jgi:LDH2 family malate/lactate/ureidoglycolate dehydrogenase